MLQELTAATGATGWAVASMLFFLAVYVVVAARAFFAAPTELDARARLVLDDGGSETAVRPNAGGGV